MLEQLKEIKKQLEQVNIYYLKIGNNATLQEMQELRQIINILKSIEKNS